MFILIDTGERMMFMSADINMQEDYTDDDVKERRLLKAIRDDVIVSKLETDNEQQLDQLIVTLKDIQKEWQEIIIDLKKEQEEYKELMSRVNAVKNMIINDGLKSKVSLATKIKLLRLKHRK